MRKSPLVARMSRPILHLLLSLVLLVSQQMALAHGWSHWNEEHQGAPTWQDGQPHAASDRPDSPALHGFCAECAADAQLDFALPLPAYALSVPKVVDSVRVAPFTLGVQPPQARPYQPRAPPRAN